MKHHCAQPSQKTGVEVPKPPQRLEHQKSTATDDQKVVERLESVRDSLRTPLGKHPERDERIKSAWRSSD